MNPIQRVAFESEITQAKSAVARGELAAGFSHLERAHVIGQADVRAHVRSHWLMLAVEFRRRRPVAIIGQASRLVLGMLGSAVGIVPIGNTGGTDISMFKRMTIVPDLQNIIDGRAPGADRPRASPEH